MTTGLVMVVDVVVVMMMMIITCLSKHNYFLTGKYTLITYWESTGLCSGGPKYANNVAILSKGRRPTAL
jgi:hypothetical protein